VAGVPVGELCWSSLGVPLPGTVPANVKQKFQRGLYPQLDEAVLAAGNYLTDEASWDAEAAAQDGSCGRYCVTDTHIILPCELAYVAPARPGEVGKEVGDWAGDAARRVTGKIGGIDSAIGYLATGCFMEEYPIKGPESSVSNSGFVASFDSSRVVPTADENRPKTLYHLPCIKVADAAVNAAQVDMMALADQVAEINGSKADRTELAQLGVGQTWQDVTAERSFEVTYTNTIGKPIMVSVYLAGDAEQKLLVDGVVVAGVGIGTNSDPTLTAIVPSSSTYVVSLSNGSLLRNWSELR
jgi:hypothetical protein